MEALLARQVPAGGRLRMSQAAHAVLHDHHRPVDDDAEVQGAEAHQVGADLVADHAGEGEQHGQRNHRCRDQGRSDVAEEQEQHRDHQRRALDQVLLDGGNRLVDQNRAVVHRLRDHAGGQRPVDFVQALVHRLRHRAAVLAQQHEDGAQHHFAAVLGGGTGAQLFANLYLGHIADAHRHPIGRADDDVGDVCYRRHLAWRANQILLAAPLDIAGADIAVVALQRLHHVGQAQAMGHQLVRRGCHLVFLGKAADGVDLGHTGHIAQLRLDDPVLNLAQIGRGVGRAVGLQRTGLALHRPHIDFTQARRDRPQRGGQAAGQLGAGLLHALVHQLAREVDIGAVLEHHGHLRQAVARQRARLLQIRQAGHRRLNRKGDTLLGLQRRVAGCVGVDLDLHIGDVGHGVDRQTLIAEDAQGSHAQHTQQHQPALRDGKADDFFKHGW